MHHIVENINRNQITMMALKEMVHPDSWVRLVDFFADALPLEELGFTLSIVEKEGCKETQAIYNYKIFFYKFGLQIMESNFIEAANFNVWVQPYLIYPN